MSARDERGSAAVFVLGLALVLFGVAGLVIDGGLALNARQQVADDAEQAARAGALRVDLVGLRGSGDVQLDRAAAASAALAFLGARGYAAGEATVSTTATTVVVSAHRTVPTALLSIVFINSFTVSADATARAAVGITREAP